MRHDQPSFPRTKCERGAACEVRRTRRLLDGCLELPCPRSLISAFAEPVTSAPTPCPSATRTTRNLRCSTIPGKDPCRAPIVNMPVTIVPANGNHSVLAFLVLVAVARIFIKIEFAICAAIDAKLDGPRGILRGVLDLRTHRERWNPRARRAACVREAHLLRSPGRP